MDEYENADDYCYGSNQVYSDDNYASIMGMVMIGIFMASTDMIMTIIMMKTIITI